MEPASGARVDSTAGCALAAVLAAAGAAAAAADAVRVMLEPRS